MKNFFGDLSLDEILEIVQGLAVSNLLPSEEALHRLLEFEQSGEDVEGRLRFIWGGAVLKKYLEFKASRGVDQKEVRGNTVTVQENHVEFRYSVNLVPKNVEPGTSASSVDKGMDHVEPTEIFDVPVEGMEPSGVLIPLDPLELEELLSGLRTNFFLACCRPLEDGGQQRRVALSDLNAVRNTSIGQAFLKDHPLFFEKIDQELIRLEIERRRLRARS